MKQEEGWAYFLFSGSGVVWIVFMALEADFIAATLLYVQIKRDLRETKAQGYFLHVERQDSTVIPSLV